MITERDKSQNQDGAMMPAKEVERAVDEDTIDDICQRGKESRFEDSRVWHKEIRKSVVSILCSI